MKDDTWDFITQVKRIYAEKQYFRWSWQINSSIDDYAFSVLCREESIDIDDGGIELPVDILVDPFRDVYGPTLMQGVFDAVCDCALDPDYGPTDKYDISFPLRTWDNTARWFLLSYKKTMELNHISPNNLRLRKRAIELAKEETIDMMSFMSNSEEDETN